jgi:hypothetical protein
VLESELRGQHVPPLRHPEIVWRAGIDLAPLDPADPATEAWLTALVWPGETGRADRVRSALRIAAAEPSCSRETASTSSLTPSRRRRETTLVVQTPASGASRLARAPRADRGGIRRGTMDHPRRALAARGMARRADRIERSR